MVDTAYPKSSNCNWLRWVARACLLASAISILIVSYFFYAPYIYIHPFSSPQIGQTVWNGGVLLAIAGFAWRWSGPGGIIAMIYVCFVLLQSTSLYALDPEHPPLLIPLPVYFVLYGTFIAGGILHLIVGLRQKIAFPYPKSQVDKQIRWAARITSVASIAIFAIIYTVIYLKWWVFGCIPALVLAGIAWAWPAPGGILIVLMSALGLWNLLDVTSNYDIEILMPALILCVMLLAGGVLHLVTSWRQRKRT